MIKKVRVHWHFNKKLYSVVDRSTGRVIEHKSGPIFMRDCKFVVQPAGHARVLREKRKNVHSYIRGTRINRMPDQEFKCAIPVGCDPYVADYWFRKDDGAKITMASAVKMTTSHEGKAVVEVV